MKRLILVTLLITIGLCCKAESPYQPWETFQGDTLRYLTVNFEENKERYIGQKLEKLVNDYELPIEYLNIPPRTYGEAEGVVFSYMSGDDMFHYIGPETPVHYIAISFKNKIVLNHSILRDKKTDIRLFDNREILKNLKDAIVETIEVRTYYE